MVVRRRCSHRNQLSTAEMTVLILQVKTTQGINVNDMILLAMDGSMAQIQV